jgi:hypothetical protein
LIEIVVDPDEKRDIDVGLADEECLHDANVLRILGLSSAGAAGSSEISRLV